MSKLGKQRSRWKIQRGLGLELPGLGKPGALERRPYPSGAHGMKPRKFSDYGLKLREKQKMLLHYGLREEQLKRFVKKAKRSPSTNWMDTLIGDLESRLDNLVFRLGFAPSIPSARQLVGHNHVLVNGKRMNIPSAIIKVGSQISLTPRAYQGVLFFHTKTHPRLEVPGFLERKIEGDLEVGILRSRPFAGDIPFAFEKNLVTEFYSKIN